MPLPAALPEPDIETHCNLRQCLEWIAYDLVPIPKAYDIAHRGAKDNLNRSSNEDVGLAKRALWQMLFEGKLVAKGYKGTADTYDEATGKVTYLYESIPSVVPKEHWEYNQINWDDNSITYKDTSDWGLTNYIKYIDISVPTIDLFCPFPPEDITEQIEKFLAHPAGEKYQSSNIPSSSSAKFLDLSQAVSTFLYGSDTVLDESGLRLEDTEERHINKARTTIFRALRDGNISAVGHYGNSLYSSSFSGDWEDTEWYNHSETRTPIPADFWKAEAISWYKSSAKNRNGEYEGILIAQDVFLSYFKKPEIIIQPDNKQLSKAINQEKTSAGRPREYEWDDFYKEVCIYIIKNGALGKQEALIAYLTHWSEKTFGKAPATSTLKEKLKPLYDTAKEKV